jgi:hypothetical protein
LPLTAKLLLLDLWASFGFELKRLQVVLGAEHFPAPVPRDNQKFTGSAFWQYNFKRDFDQAKF